VKERYRLYSASEGYKEAPEEGTEEGTEEVLAFVGRKGAGLTGHGEIPLTLKVTSGFG
jgi:hypothetical protein